MTRRKPLVVDGVPFPSLKAAAKHYGVPYSTAHERYSGKEWTIREALGLDAPPHNNACTVDGVTFPSPHAAAEHYNVPHSTFQRRLTYDGWTLRQALGLDDPPPRRRPYAKRDAIFAASNAAHRAAESQTVQVTEVTLGETGDLSVSTRAHHVTGETNGMLSLQDAPPVPRHTLDAVEPDETHWRWTYASLTDDRHHAETLTLRRAIADIREEKRRLTKREERLLGALHRRNDREGVNA